MEGVKDLVKVMRTSNRKVATREGCKVQSTGDHTLLLKLCNLKVLRAFPMDLSTAFRNSKDFASHVLSFLESKRSDHAIERAEDHGETLEVGLY